jgi:homoserine acetyltransferase
MQAGIIPVLDTASRMHCLAPGAPGSGARAISGALLQCIAACALADSASQPGQGEYALHRVSLESRRIITEPGFHYRTLGMPTDEETGLITNAVLPLRGAAPRAGYFLADAPAVALFGSGEPLDASQYLLIFPDQTDDLAGPDQVVQMQYRLPLEYLGANQLRLIDGNGETGTQAWLWAGAHPCFVDALAVVDCVASADAGQLPRAERDQLAAAPGAAPRQYRSDIRRGGADNCPARVASE